MSTASIQFVRFSGQAYQQTAAAWLPADMLLDAYSARQEVASSGASAQSTANPAVVAPDPGYTHVLVHAIDGDIIAHAGDDPTASQTAGVLIRSGDFVVLPCRAGQKVAVIDRA